MIQRRSYPIDGRSEIALTTENMADATWAVVVSIKQVDGDTERVTDLPVPTERFPSESDAEAFGLGLARRWIAENMPHAA
jgi:hypothetical protein